MSGHAFPPSKSARLPSWKIGKVMVLCFYLFFILLHMYYGIVRCPYSFYSSCPPSFSLMFFYLSPFLVVVPFHFVFVFVLFASLHDFLLPTEGSPSFLLRLRHTLR